MRRAFLLLISLSAAQVLWAQTASPENSLPRLLQESELAERRGDSVAAAEYLTRAARLHPESPLPLFGLGRIQARNGQELEAVESLRAALRVDPRHVGSRVLLAEIFERSGASTAAEAELREALNVDPADVDAAKLMAAIFLKQEAAARAMPILETSRAKHPGDPALLYLLGRAHAMLLQTEKAEKYYEESLRADANFSPSWLALGDLLALKPEARDRAVECLEKFVALEPDDARGHRSLGGLYQEMGRAGRAAEELRRAADLEPESSETLYRLAAVLTALGREEEAASLRRKFQQLRDREQELRQKDLAFTTAFRDGQRLTQSNSLREAAGKFEEALQIRPDSETAHAMLAKVLYSSRSYAAADRHIRGAIERSPANGEYRYVHGLVLMARGENAEAEKELTLAGRLMPIIGDIFNRLGSLAGKRGAWQEAVEQFERAVKVEPEEAAYHLNLANAYEKQGNAELAAKHRKRYRDLVAPSLPQQP